MIYQVQFYTLFSKYCLVNITIYHLLFTIRIFVHNTNAYTIDQILDYLKVKIVYIIDILEKKVVDMKLMFTGREEKKNLLKNLEAVNMKYFF